MTALGLRSPVATRIYFIQQGADGPIKIGIAQNPDQRLWELQAGNPQRLYLRATLVGTITDERNLHRHFAAGRIHREWFKADTPELPELIAAAAADIFDEEPCERCLIRPIAPTRKKYCDRCSR